MLIRFLKTVVGILLIPLAIGTSRAFYEQMLLLGNAAQGTHMLERGIMVYVLFHVVIARPIYLYVVGHECVHVLATWICGGRVERFNISKSGGSVVTSKTNFFIELSPYFVPIYTLLLAPVFLVIRSNIFGHPNFNINDLFIFLVGITLAFHFVMTS
ncbi:MAG TPA: hypothetical protein PKG81_03395, partial [Candidatus Omnitrophota bacterium]|nr:hypothetical protein [Candidatus Omnitrophota bacterium]